MSSLRPPGLEHRAAAIPGLRGYGELLQPLGKLLPLLLLFSLGSGLLLRQLRLQPAPAELMNILGGICWLLGLVLATPLQRMLLRLDRHRLSPRLRDGTRLRLLLAALIAAAALSVAMLPIHFGFDQSQVLFTIDTLSDRDLPFRSGYFLLLLHLLVGPACLLLSTGVLRLLRLCLPGHIAALAWLGSGALFVVLPAALHRLDNLPMSLGQLSIWIVEFMFANKQLASPYLQELLRPVLLRAGGIWLAALLLVWLSLLPLARPWQRLRPLWLACCGALLLSALRTLALTLRWTEEVLPLSPDNWWSILTFGMHCAWLIWILCCCTMEPQRLMHSLRRDWAWLLLLPGGLLGLTIPCVQADEASRLTMLCGLLLLLPVLLLGILIPLQIARMPSAKLRIGAQLLLLGLLLPLPGQSLSLAMLGYLQRGFILPTPEAEPLRIWLCLLGLALLAWPGLLAGLLAMRFRQHRRRPAAAH